MYPHFPNLYFTGYCWTRQISGSPTATLMTIFTFVVFWAAFIRVQFHARPWTCRLVRFDFYCYCYFCVQIHNYVNCWMNRSEFLSRHFLKKSLVGWAGFDGVLVIGVGSLEDCWMFHRGKDLYPVACLFG